nr:NBS-LRR disease resistance protein [Dasypyrum villosum]
MEATAISIGKSVLSRALNYAQSAVAEEVALQLGVQHDHSFISDELEMMRGFLMAAHDERDDNMVVKIWVKQVRDVSYAVEDCLLDFAVRLEKQSWWCLSRKVLAAIISKPTSAVGQSIISSATMSAADDARLRRHKAKMDLVELINCKDDALQQELPNCAHEIHSIEEWDCIKTCFPNNNKGSRIIVCTEQVEVACLCIGAEDEALVSQEGRNSAEKGSTSYVAPTGVTSSAHKNILTRMETMATLEESRLIGRGNEKEEIIKLISNKDVQQFHLFSLWGMGGIGKTTLVRDIYQSQEISSMFDKRACVTVMRPFNSATLLESLNMQFRNNNETNTDLWRCLEGRRYFLVLDDLWSIGEWDAIKQHLPETAASCIIITTREENIAKHCSKDDINIYKLNHLGPDDACTLFTKKVFKETVSLDERYPELVEPAKLILKKCRGLPLAIVTIGGFLPNQPKTAFEWRKMNEHISAELEMNPELEIIKAVLVKSYDGLPYHLKACFLYLAIFPEDYMIARRRLVRRWIAEGYSSEVRGKSMEEMLDGYFKELISRSMILPSQQSIFSRKGIDSCHVHDLIREIAVSKSLEENLVFTLEEGCRLNNQSTMRHLAVSSDWKGDQSEFENIVDLSRVRSLTVFGNWRPFYISDKMRLLRVLDLEGKWDLVDHHLEHIGKLVHLRYLSLREHADIFHLPNSLGNLRQLQTLDISGTSIIKLPRTIIKLAKMQHILASDTGKSNIFDDAYEQSLMSLPIDSACCCVSCCVPNILAEDLVLEDEAQLNRRDVCTAFCCSILPYYAAGGRNLGGVEVPRGIWKLKALHTLRTIDISVGKAALEDIKKLTRLRKLGLTGISKRNSQELCSAIARLSSLESLSLCSEGETGLSGCLDGLSSPPENLQSLKLIGNLVKLPEWIEGLKNLVKLKLERSRISEHDAAIQVLGNLPNLSTLRLLPYSFVGEEVRLSFGREAFLSLKVLQLDWIKNLRSVGFEEGAAPKLELLQYYGWDYYGWNRPDAGVFRGLPYLPSLKEFMLHESDWRNTKFMEDLQGQLGENENKPVLKSWQE